MSKKLSNRPFPRDEIGTFDNILISQYVENEKAELCPSLKKTLAELLSLFFGFFINSVSGFRQYSKDPYPIGDEVWGEEVMLKEFGYFAGLINDNAETVWETDYSSCRRHDYESGENILCVNKLNIIYLLNNFRMSMLFDKLEKINLEADEDTFFLRKLIAARALRIRANIDSFVQFTYAGARYVASKSALKPNLKISDDKKYNAIPFCHAQSLSQIDSARLIEKVNHQIVYKSEHEGNEDHEIKIAVFGSFSDEGKLNIEALADKGFFRNENDGSVYRVKVVRFKLLKHDDVSVVFEEQNTDSKEKLIGDLFNVSFLKQVSDKYDITCLLDMGCFYSDTSRGLDFRRSSPYEEVNSCIRIIDAQQERYGIEKVNTIAYINLYKAYLKWIEFTFYGESHQYEFDPRLFATLIKVKRDAKEGHSIFTYLSRSRGEALKTKFQYDDVCRTEFYKGVGVVVYDWRRSNPIKELECQRMYFSEVYRAEYKNSVAFRFWKLMKSIDDYFFTKDFTRLIKTNMADDDDPNVTADLRFVQFCNATYIEFDYSHLKGENVIVYSIVTEDEKAVEAGYLRAAKEIMEALLKIVFDEKCYDECSTAFCRTILSNTITADATTFEHLMLSHMILNRKLQSEFRRGDVVCDKRRYNDQRILSEKTDPHLTTTRHTVNNVVGDAINAVNSRPYSEFRSARDDLYDAVKDYSDDIDPGALLERLGLACDRLGFSNCTIAACCN